MFMCFVKINIIDLNFLTSNVLKSFFKNILQNLGDILHVFALVFFMLNIWQFNAFCIPVLSTVIVTIISRLDLIYFVEVVFNLYIRLACFIEMLFVHFLINFVYLHFIFSTFSFSMLGCLLCLVIVLILCVCNKVLYVSCLLFPNCNDYHQVLLSLMSMLILKNNLK